MYGSPGESILFRPEHPTGTGRRGRRPSKAGMRRFSAILDGGRPRPPRTPAIRVYFRPERPASWWRVCEPTMDAVVYALMLTGFDPEGVALLPHPGSRVAPLQGAFPLLSHVAPGRRCACPGLSNCSPSGCRNPSPLPAANVDVHAEPRFAAITCDALLCVSSFVWVIPGCVTGVKPRCS